VSFELLTTSMVDPRAAVACGTASLPFTWTYAYDVAGNRTKVTDPLGNHTDCIYNALDQPTSVRGRARQPDDAQLRHWPVVNFWSSNGDDQWQMPMKVSRSNQHG
jgi:hypothetical protein